MKNLNKKLLSILLSFLLMATLVNVPVVQAVAEGPNIERDNFVTAHDVGAGGTDWFDSVEVVPGSVVEFRVVAWNNGKMPANHVQIIGSIPQNMGNQWNFSATIQAPYGGGTSITDTANVKVKGGSQQTFRYEPNHARIFGVTNLYNCPTGCALDDKIASTGLEVGDIPAGGSVQVAYKARMTNLVSPTAVPSAVPTAGPTSQPNIVINNTNTNTFNPTVTVNNDQPKVVEKAKTPVDTLPKTGLPLVAWSLAGLTPIGLKLRRFGKKDAQSNPLDQWIERQENIS